MLTWFTENPCGTHAKLHALPIGPSFRSTLTFGTEDIRDRRSRLVRLVAAAAERAPPPRTRRLFAAAMNLLTSDDATFGPHCFVRRDAAPRVAALGRALNGDGTADDGDEAERLGWSAYARALLTSQLVWAPPGRGIDSHRAWEALLAGAVPVVLSSPLDGAYAGLRVLAVANFSSALSEGVLRATAAAAEAAGPPRIDVLSPLFAFYWLTRIEAAARGAPAARDDVSPFLVPAAVGDGVARACAARAQPWEPWPVAPCYGDTAYALVLSMVAIAVVVWFWLFFSTRARGRKKGRGADER
jgi:hypothetical protein